MTLIEQFTAEVAKYDTLAKMVENVREDSDGDVFYEYDGSFTCEVCYDGDYLDWGDVCGPHGCRPNSELPLERAMASGFQKPAAPGTRE